MAKILLISTGFEEVSLYSATTKNTKGDKTDDSSHYPLGLAYLHSYLEKNNHIVETLFHNNYSSDKSLPIIKKKINDFRPDFVCLQILTPNRISSYEVIEYTKNFFPEIKIILGGIHSTAMYESLLKKYPYTIIILGEGEVTLNELIKKYTGKKEELRDIDGIAYEHNGKIIKNKQRNLIEDLNSLPFPKHELFLNNARKSACIITSRGCPFACSFCCLDKISQRRIRKRSVKNVIEEIEYILKLAPQINNIWIHDDTFFIDNQRVIDFCNEIVKKNLRLTFTCSGRLKPLSKEMIIKLEEANFNKVLLGLESGDNEILKRCHKGINQNDAIEAFKLFSKSKIRILAFLIVGLPGETIETIKTTGRFVQKLQKLKYVYYNDTSILSVYPGTEVYEMMRSAGAINDDYWFTDQPTPLFTIENSQEQLLYFKDVLLDYISLDRIFTPRGFILQLPVLPYALKYLYNNKSVLKTIIIRIIKGNVSPEFYSKIKNIKKFIK